jgi:hypothetical protein
MIVLVRWDLITIIGLVGFKQDDWIGGISVNLAEVGKVSVWYWRDLWLVFGESGWLRFDRTFDLACED